MPLSKDIIKFNSNTTARDKFYRTFQYGARFLLWSLEGETDTQFITRLRRLEAALGLSRKLFRLGNFMDLAHKAIDSLNILDFQLMVLGVTANVFKGIWLLMDHSLWFSKIGVIHIRQQMWAKWSLRAWLIALVAATLADLKKLNTVIRKIENEKRLRRKTDDSPNSPALQTELHHSLINFYRDFCDLFIPLSGLKYINPGIGAACGLISSLIEFRQEWEKHIKPFEPVMI